MKIYITTKKYLIWVICLSLSICTILGMNAGRVKDFVAAAAPKKDLPIYCVDRTDKIISMSFDAAWDEVNI